MKSYYWKQSDSTDVSLYDRNYKLLIEFKINIWLSLSDDANKIKTEY